jgi:hypothetical protein
MRLAPLLTKHQARSLLVAGSSATYVFKNTVLNSRLAPCTSRQRKAPVPNPLSAAEASKLTRSNNESDSFWSPSLLEVGNATTTTVARSHGSQHSRACSLRLLRGSQTIPSQFSKIFSIGTFGITKLGEKNTSLFTVFIVLWTIPILFWTQFGHNFHQLGYLVVEIQ